MRVGIITFHCSYNYGSVLQAYALQNYLKNQGHDVKIIDFILLSDFEQYKIFRTKEYKNNLKSLISDLIYLNKNVKRKIQFKKFTDNFLNITEERYTEEKSMIGLNDKFDCFICGSDQIWNINCTKGVVPAYFLSFADEAKLKVSYAPSIAHLEFDNSEFNNLSTYINRLDYISVRERSTLPLVKSITNKKVIDVLDPTMLLNVEQYEKISEKVEYNNKYIFLYVLEPNKEIIKYCNKLSIEKGLKIIYLTKRRIGTFKNSVNVYGVSPEKWLGLIKNAEYVITNSFHATVFSILFKKQFVTFTTLKSYSRMTDLLSKLHINDRIYKSDFNVDNKTDYTKVFKYLSELREKSKEFLFTALND